MKSIWESETGFGVRKPLPENLSVHTVVIGAGMAGILTAYFLHKKGHRVIVVEAKHIAGGQTGRTTAKITSQHGMCYDKMLRKVGRKRTQGYARANERAIRLYEQLIQEENIACHFERLSAYLYTRHEARIPELKREASVAASLGLKAHFVEGSEITELPFEACGAVCFENQAQFQPLLFIRHLAEKLEIYEDTKVLSVKGHQVFTNRGQIRAEHIVFATHYPITNMPGFYFLRQHQERSYVLALEHRQKLGGMYYSIDENGLSLRSYGNILLLGGGGHRTGKNSCKAGCENKSTGYIYLRKMAQIYYPKATEAAAWSAQDCMPHDEIPFIGRYSVLRPYWYVATGFHKWGMTSAMLAATMLADRICGISNEFERVFSPQRLLFRASIKQLTKDIGESIQGLTKGLFSRKKHRCPHMGCRLEWNGEETSYDCPCHGSRFDAKGVLLDNPAQIDLDEKK